MTTQIKKTISIILVLVQLIAILPLGMTEAKAADGQSPILNQTIVGTVDFQSFNFLGDNAYGSDGVDYSATFYYTDDYFSPSAINTKANGKTADWDDLSANELSLASCSIDFAVASMTSAHGDVLKATDRTWDNSDYTDKDKNIKAFLTTCGFTNIEPSATMRIRPTNDSIAYTIASKPITVWDEASGTNKRFTLVAVGVRGAGYGQEWASNVTIGTAGNGANVVRHRGFDESAQTVCEAVRDYLSAHGITENVKYWVTGFSRSAAVANLTAGYLSDDPNAYHTRGRTDAGCADVYAYTWEAPQAASTSENALHYRNIHNIINAMDAVPKASPGSFNHQRLGIDYRMPYYGNTTTDENEVYYARMREVLKTIAVGAYNYGGKAYQEDPLISATDPNNYPYNRPVTIYTITPWQLFQDAVDDVITVNFGTVVATGNGNRLGTNLYMDKFIDNLIDVFLVSTAWDRDYSRSTTDVITHRTRFINNYQNDFRNVLGYLLDYSGPAFMVLVDKIIGAVGDQLAISNSLDNIGVGFAFVNFYEYPNSTYEWGIPPFIDAWVGKPSWAGKTRRNVLISEAQPVVRNVMRNTTGSFRDPQGISQSAFESSLDHLVALVVDLYADELSKYNSNYFGTCLHYMWNILSVHEQETVMSWIKSLDPNHMNRSCRTLTVPKDADVTLYEFRSQYNETPSDGETAAPVVARLRNGEFVAEDYKDQRITKTESGESIIIRYPSSLDIRADVTARSTVDLSCVQVNDYQTAQDHTWVSEDYESQYAPAADSLRQLYTNTNRIGTVNYKASDTNSKLSGGVEFAAGDTLHILVNDMADYNSTDTKYVLSLDKAPKTVVAEYAMPTVVAENVSPDALSTEAEGFVVRDGNLVWTGAVTASTRNYEQVYGQNYNFTEYQLSGLNEANTVAINGLVKSIQTRQTISVMPAGNVYFDDSLQTVTASAVNGQPDYQEKVPSAVASEISAAASNCVSFRFTGTRIDVYMNTDSSTGKVGAYLLNEDASALYQQNGKTFSKIIDGTSEGALYNVPVVSFFGMNSGTYTLVLVPNKGKTARIDGVRIYNESRAVYQSLREMLIDPENWVSDGSVSGAVYLDGGTTTTDVAAYQKDGPKGEVYLSGGNGIAFQIDGFDASASYRIGLSAVSGSPVRVQLNREEPFWISAATHMFYDLHPTENGEVVIRNLQGGILSVTDIEVTPAVLSAPLRTVSLSASPALLRFAASLSAPAEQEETPEPTTEPAPEPTADLTNTVQQLLSSFIQSLFGGIARLFGN